MRTLLYYVIVGMLCLTNTNTNTVTAQEKTLEELSQSERMAKIYDGWWLASSDEKARCKTVLLSLTAGKTIKPASEAGTAIDSKLYAAGCLDLYSHLYGFGIDNSNDPPKKKLDAPSIEKIGQYLFVYINIFDKVDTALIEMVQKHRQEWQDSTDTVVIDVRDNPGGNIGELHAILNKLFSPKAGIRHLEPTGRMAFTSNPNHFTTDQIGMLSGRKIRILTNQATASASEWMIETLCNEWYPDSCVSLGTTTYGKAILQCGVNDKEFAVHLTCAEWFLADKRSPNDLSPYSRKVQGVGIVPDKPMTFSTCGRFAYSCIAAELAQAGL